jgi:release factor glutamine methyltransferase
MYWEIDEELGFEVLALFRNTSFREVELKQDMFGRDRFIKAIYHP